MQRTGKSVEIDVDGLVQGHVHDFFLPEMRSASDEKLVHANAYYTLNEIPKTNNESKVGDADAPTLQSQTKPTQRQHPMPEGDQWLRYSGKSGPGAGKHVVLIAADQEYRSEQSMPMLAKVLSEHHGFDCTVLFSTNEDGLVDPTIPSPLKDPAKFHHIPGLEHLASADAVLFLARNMKLDDASVKHLYDYFDSGKPLLVLRTGNHGVSKKTKPYVVAGQNVSLDKMLGGTFRGHYGGWHRESTRGVTVAEQKSHPILTGVNDIWGPSDVYRCHTEKSPFPDDCTALVLGQPLQKS